MLFMFLTSKFGKVPDKTQAQVRTLSRDRLQALSVALLDFKTVKDLEAWVKAEKKGT